MDMEQKSAQLLRELLFPDLRIYFAFTQTGEISCQKIVDLLALVGSYGVRCYFFLLRQSL